MRPQVESRLTAYGLFQHLEELPCNVELGGLGGLRSQQAEGIDVLSPTGAFHVDIEHGIVHLAHDAFTTGKHRCLLIQEVYPQVDIGPPRCLVGNISEQRAAVFALIVEQIAQNVFFRDAHATVS